METAAAESVIQPGSKTATPAGSAIQASAKTSPLRLLTSGTPTNWNMLVFRTLNRCVHVWIVRRLLSVYVTAQQ
jgi:hypothetical protein